MEKVNKIETEHGKSLIMVMACCGRQQAWKKSAGDPKVGEKAWCVWCDKQSTIEKVF